MHYDDSKLQDRAEANGQMEIEASHFLVLCAIHVLCHIASSTLQ